MGVFAMHGLSDHGAPSHAMNPPMPAVMAPTHTGHAIDPALVVAGGTSAGDAAPASDGHSPDVAMAGLCVAVLAGAILGFLQLRPLRCVFLGPRIGLPFLAQRPSGRRDRDPPSLFELSVLRT
jgi:hypothetical protein